MQHQQQQHQQTMMKLSTPKIGAQHGGDVVQRMPVKFRFKKPAGLLVLASAAESHENTQSEMDEGAEDSAQRLPIKFRLKKRAGLSVLASAADLVQRPSPTNPPQELPAKKVGHVYAKKPLPLGAVTVKDDDFKSNEKAMELSSEPALLSNAEPVLNSDAEPVLNSDAEPVPISNDEPSQGTCAKNKNRKKENEYRWMERYNELKIYKKKHGDCNVPKGYEANPQLGRWVQNQRMHYKRLIQQEEDTKKPSAKKKGKSPMSQHHADLLKDIGFQFKLRDEWIDRYRELETHYKKHGNCNVPRRYKANPSLGHFVAKQRFQMKLYRENKPSSMTLERIQLLEQINFDWNLLEAAWMEHYKELEEYYNDNGNCLVPEQWPKNPSLGFWVANQRTQYKLFVDNKPAKITPDRIELLKRLNFELNVRDARWMFYYGKLARFVRENGMGSLPAKASDLRDWTDAQRYRYKDLSPRQRDLIELLGITWMGGEE